MTEPAPKSFASKDIISWVLQGGSALALAVGASFFNSMTGNIKELSSAVQELKVQVAVMSKNEERLTRAELGLLSLERRLNAHSNAAGHPVLELRVSALEEDGK